MRMGGYKNGTDPISNTTEGQELTSHILHPLDIVVFLHSTQRSSETWAAPRFFCLPYTCETQGKGQKV